MNEKKMPTQQYNNNNNNRKEHKRVDWTWKHKCEKYTKIGTNNTQSKQIDKIKDMTRHEKKEHKWINLKKIDEIIFFTSPVCCFLVQKSLFK